MDRREVVQNLLWVIVAQTQLANTRSTQLLQSVIHV